jgi:hypothetical protein
MAEHYMAETSTVPVDRNLLEFLDLSVQRLHNELLWGGSTPFVLIRVTILRRVRRYSGWEEYSKRRLKCSFGRVTTRA